MSAVRRRLFPLAVVAVVLAGCGDTSGGEASGGSGRAARHAARPARAPCPASIAGAARTRVISAQTDLRTCAYAAGADSFRVTLDDLPQAWFRYDRAQIERWQNTEGWAHHPAQQPRLVDGVGAGAFWVRATRELMASDGRRIVTVKIVRPVNRSARAVAIRAARPVLGPPHVPVRTGP